MFKLFLCHDIFLWRSIIFNAPGSKCILFINDYTENRTIKWQHIKIPKNLKMNGKKVKRWPMYKAFLTKCYNQTVSNVQAIFLLHDILFDQNECFRRQVTFHSITTVCNYCNFSLAEPYDIKKIPSMHIPKFLPKSWLSNNMYYILGSISFYLHLQRLINTNAPDSECYAVYLPNISVAAIAEFCMNFLTAWYSSLAVDHNHCSRS